MIKKKIIYLIAILGLFTACHNDLAPEPILPIPTPEQVAWQKLETYAFIHFGLNTFNDLEWGYGDTPASTFNPSNLDCDQWVSVVKASGLKGVILTAKHHDGFCLWPTKTTEYSVKNSPWKDGKGDMVKELSEACKRAGLKFGIYLSPWDRNSEHYGTPEYVEIFHAQMEELLTNYGPIFEYWFDGANGGDGYYGGTNERRSIDATTYYQYSRARETIKRLHPSAMIFGGTEADIRWIGNEHGSAGQTNWSPINEDANYTQFPYGNENGNIWLGGECDVSIRPGWFYHKREDHQVHSLAHLTDLYYRSIGRNATFLLNFPVALTGRIHPSDSTRAVEWHKSIQSELRTNLLENISVKASNERNGSKYAVSNSNDSDWDSYWATNDTVINATLTYDFEKPTTLNRVMIQEYIPLGQRVKKFSVEIEKNGEWISIKTTDAMSTIGYKRILRFQTETADKLRINFIDAKGALCINNVEAFLAPALIVEPKISRNEKDIVTIKAGDIGSKIYYTLDNSEPTIESKLYTAPFLFAKKGTIKAISYDSQFDKKSSASVTELDIPASSYTVVNPTSSRTDYLFDGNGYTSYQLQTPSPELVVTLAKEALIKGFTYTPNQGRDNASHISNYQLFVDDNLVSEGEFSNIKNHPIKQIINFNSVKGKKVKLKSIKQINNNSRVTIGDFSVITE